MPTGYEGADSALNELMNKKFGSNVPSPGGLDLNALLQRSIQGTIAGAQEETGIKRKQVASDLLSQQLAQAAQELQNRMHGYEFEQTKGFDQSLLNDPRLAATLTDLFHQQGVNPLASPTSRSALAAMHQFTPGVESHQNIAAEILKNYHLTGPPTAIGPDGKTIIQLPDPPEVSWARNVLGASGGATNAPASAKPAPAPTVDKHVPYGIGRAAAGGLAEGAGFYTGSKAFGAGAARFAPNMSPGKLATGKIASGFVGSGLASLVLSQLDPRTIQAQSEYPLAAIPGTLVGAGGASKARQALEKLPFLARFTRRGMQAKAAVEAAEAAGKARGVGLGPNYPGSFGGQPPVVSPPVATGAAPQGPYKPKVKGYEEFLKKQFGE